MTSYISELNSVNPFRENLGHYDVTVCLEDVDPEDKIDGSIVLEPGKYETETVQNDFYDEVYIKTEIVDPLELEPENEYREEDFHDELQEDEFDEEDDIHKDDNKFQNGFHGNKLPNENINNIPVYRVFDSVQLQRANAIQNGTLHEYNKLLFLKQKIVFRLESSFCLNNILIFIHNKIKVNVFLLIYIFIF